MADNSFFSTGIQFQKDIVHIRTWSFSVSGPWPIYGKDEEVTSEHDHKAEYEIPCYCGFSFGRQTCYVNPL